MCPTPVLCGPDNKRASEATWAASNRPSEKQKGGERQRDERQECRGRRRASEEKRKTLTRKNRPRKIKDTGGEFPPMFRVEDDICSPKNKVCSVSVCLYPSARYVCICVRFMRSSLIGSAGRCATEGKSTIGCVKTQSASASARACREGRLVHMHAHTRTQIYGCSRSRNDSFLPSLFHQFLLSTVVPLS